MNPITKNLPVFLQLIEANWKTATHLGKTFTQSCAEKCDGVSAFYRMKFDLVLRKIWLIFLACDVRTLVL